MIVPKAEIASILRGELGEATTIAEPPVVGSTCWIRETPRAKPACDARVADVWALNGGGYVVLLERVPVPAHKPKPRALRSDLRLTRAQRLGLFQGQCPRIAGDGKCPVSKGEVVRLSSKVALRVLDVRPVRGGGWSLHYEIDRADTVRLLKRGEGYTSDEAQAVDEAGEAPPSGWTDGGIDTRAEQQKILTRATRERLSTGEQLDSLLDEARGRHVDVHDRARKIQREIDLLKRDLDQEAA